MRKWKYAIYGMRVWEANIVYKCHKKEFSVIQLETMLEFTIAWSVVLAAAAAAAFKTSLIRSNIKATIDAHRHCTATPLNAAWTKCDFMLILKKY